MRPSKLLACALGAVLLSFGCGRREAGDATYTHAGPAFRVTYPEAWKPEKPRYANEAFRATDPSSLPTDLDLVVFDELGDLGELLEPPLTFVRQPALEMGAQAATMLLERIRGNAAQPPRVVVFEPVLVRR